MIRLFYRAPIGAIVLTLMLIVAGTADAATSSSQGGARPDPAHSGAGLAALLAAQQAKLTAADGAANDNFGYAVAVAGDTAVVGVPYHDVGGKLDQGCVYVFTRSGTSWTQQAQITASDGAAGDRFGNAVSLVASTIVVGAPYDDAGTSTDQGSAYVFTGSGASWTEQAHLLASDGAAGDGFGCSVAISGESCVVGANQHDVDGKADQGSAYVFRRESGAWSEQKELTASDGAANDRFGYATALAGDTALIGANRKDVEGRVDQGCAYVFVRSGAAWDQEQQLFARAGDAGDRFGYSVSLSADTALIGAPDDDIGTVADQGSAYVFAHSGTTWTEQQKLVAADGAAADEFGYAVALADRVALVGAWWDDVGSHANQGSAYIFLRSGTAWNQHDHITASDGATNDRFGCAVSLSDAVLVGAYWDDVGPNTAQGSAYVVPPDGVPPVTVASIAPASNGNGWNATPVTISLLASDPFSGVASTEYRLAGADAWTAYSAPFSVTTTGLTWWEYRSTDADGNIEETKSLVVRIDTVPPVPTARATPAANRAGWRKAAVSLTFSGKDPVSAVDFSQYRLAGTADWTTYRSTIKVKRQGITTYEHRAVDLAGNTSASKSFTLRIDSRRPTTRAYPAMVKTGTAVSLRYKVYDARPGSGMASVTLRICRGARIVRSIKAGTSASNVTHSCRWRCHLKPGRYTVKAYATDIAGNPQTRAGSARLIVR